MTRITPTISLVSLAFLAVPGIAQETRHVKAIYTKWQPGVDPAEARRYITTDAPAKAARNWLNADPKAVGQVTLSRVHPSGPEAG